MGPSQPLVMTEWIPGKLGGWHFITWYSIFQSIPNFSHRHLLSIHQMGGSRNMQGCHCFYLPSMGPTFPVQYVFPSLFLLPFSQSVPLTPSNRTGPHIPVPQQVCKSGLMNQDIPHDPKDCFSKGQGTSEILSTAYLQQASKKGSFFSSGGC